MSDRTVSLHFGESRERRLWFYHVYGSRTHRSLKQPLPEMDGGSLGLLTK